MTLLILSKLVALKNVVKAENSCFNLLLRINNYMNNAYLYSTNKVVDKENQDLTNQSNEKPIIKNEAMKLYFERAKAYDEYIKKEIDDYEKGKLHLANMMGADLDTFDQNKIDEAIKYLFPSGLFDKQARPMMKHPLKIIPPKKEAEFDITGRPFHSLYYTKYPQYYQILYDIVEHIENLNKMEDERIREGLRPDETRKLNLVASDWISYDTLKEMILDRISTEQYDYFIYSIEKLVEHPYSYEVIDFIMKFRKNKKSASESMKIPKLLKDNDGRPYITIKDCMRKSARGVVTMRGDGSGKITINGQPLTLYFPLDQEVYQVR